MSNETKPKVKVFISFDFDDKDSKESLVAEASKENAPFEFVDVSIQEQVTEMRWQKEAARLITSCNLAIILCGEQSHQSKGQTVEVNQIKALGKSYFLVAGRREETVTRPVGIGPNEKIYPRRWPTLRALLEGKTPQMDK